MSIVEIHILDYTFTKQILSVKFAKIYSLKNYRLYGTIIIYVTGSEKTGLIHTSSEIQLLSINER